jgi:hypothetical protein
MLPTRSVVPARILGRSPERLSLAEQIDLVGMTVALELYTPETVPLRRIEAIGETAEDCIAQLAARGLDPRRFEFVVLKPPY